jgi:ribonuclease HI
LEIYTDGACVPNPGPGGWGAVLRFGEHEKELYGSEPDTTTNNRMELTAPIRALQSLTRSSVVLLYTDSTYVKNGITQWLPRWKRNGWRTSTR